MAAALRFREAGGDIERVAGTDWSAFNGNMLADFLAEERVTLDDMESLLQPSQCGSKSRTSESSRDN